uniref:EF-hand domain-containing protein n=1 Tax=Rhodosorus marinus TaxID=101924 RepID=A0A7S2ZQL6_9RHOD|mmetsp:Transcript_26756/g.103931  ORF Transcript_26756/g.103931 Transcript_26756/m.103931 type:complete len:110 (+) Transcript_26756:271-600(+)
MQGDNGGTASDPRLKAWFDSVDLDKSNSIDVKELHRALILAGLEFGMNTCALLIRMHDTDRNGTINFDEFQRMHNFIMSVRVCTLRQVSPCLSPQVTWTNFCLILFLIW